MGRGTEHVPLRESLRSPGEGTWCGRESGSNEVIVEAQSAAGTPGLSIGRWAINSWNRKTAYTRQKLTASEAAREDLQRINAATSEELSKKADALEQALKGCSKLQGRTSKLYKEVRKLRAKALRAPEKCSHAVEAALVKAASGEFGGRPDIWRIKRPDGRIEDWVRDLTCRLICVRHVPASQAPGVISDIVRAFKSRADDRDGTNDENPDADASRDDIEVFSDRSARRFPVEGHVMGQIQIAKEFKAAPG